MEKYDYKRAITEDVKQYIKDNPIEWVDPFITDDIEGYWYELLWEEDCITGNGLHGYDTEEKCEEYLFSNIELGIEACNELEMDMGSLVDAAAEHRAARCIDCVIRCYLLYGCIHKALEELNT